MYRDAMALGGYNEICTIELDGGAHDSHQD